MPYIGKQPEIGAYKKLDSITAVNGQAAYTLQHNSANYSPASANHLIVSLNGVIQAPQDSFTVSGSTLTFASNLSTGDSIDFILALGDVLNVGTPSDNTVTNDKLATAPTIISKGDGGSTDGAIQLNCSQNTHGVKIKSPPHSASQSYTLTLPSTAPSNGKALITDGSGNLSFGSAGGLVKLQKQTASNDATINFTSTYITSSYNRYLLVCRNWAPASDSVPRIRFSEDNLSTFESDTYQSGIFYHGIDSSGSAHQGASTTGYHNLNRTLESNEGGHYIFDFPALNVTGKHKCIVESVMFHSNGYGYGQLNALRVNASRTYNSFQLYMSSGNIASGDFILYGVTE